MLSARKIHTISLTEPEIKQLKELSHKGLGNARVITRARVLLMAHERKIDKEIYQALDLAVSTPYDIRKRYHAGGLQLALYDKPRPGKERILSSSQEVIITAIACSDPKAGYAGWTLDLITEEFNRKTEKGISRNTVWRVLRRNKLKPHLKKNVEYTKGNATL